MTDATTRKSGLQQLADLAPALKASTTRLRKYNESIARARTAAPYRPAAGSPWGYAVAKLPRRRPSVAP